MAEKNFLSPSEKHRLNMWGVQNATILEKHTQEELANIAADTLGFEVTSSNIIGMSTATGLKTGRKAGPGNTTRDDLRVVASAVLELAKSNGVSLLEVEALVRISAGE